MDKFKQVIINWLGLDYVVNKLDNVSEDLYNRDWSSAINYSELERELRYDRINISASDVAEEFDTDDIARELDYSSIAYELDSYEIASNIDASDIAYNIDKEELAAAVDWDDLIAESLNRYFEGEKMNEFAHIVAEKIADRDGMVELVGEEVANQGVTMDEVKAMVLDFVGDPIEHRIREAILNTEVMVSAKLNVK